MSEPRHHLVEFHFGDSPRLEVGESRLSLGAAPIVTTGEVAVGLVGVAMLAFGAVMFRSVWGALLLAVGGSVTAGAVVRAVLRQTGER